MGRRFQESTSERSYGAEVVVLARQQAAAADLRPDRLLELAGRLETEAVDRWAIAFAARDAQRLAVLADPGIESVLALGLLDVVVAAAALANTSPEVD